MKRVTKKEFEENEIVLYNLTEVHSCMKICFRKDIESDSMMQYAWKYQREFFMQKKHSMSEIQTFCKELDSVFYGYFKIVLWR